MREKFKITFNCDEVVGILDRLVDGVNVQGSDGSQVDDLGGNSFLGQLLSCCQAVVNSHRMGNQRDVLAFPLC